MQDKKPNLLTRGDTFFGVCEGLGEDLRIHPNLLRLGLAGLLFWNPAAAVAVYAAAGFAVALSRLLFPVPAAAPRAEAAEQPQPVSAENEPVRVEAEKELERLAA